MGTPFSAEEFFAVFVAYNTAVWPLQLGLLALALGAVVVAFRGSERAGRAVCAILAFLWIWMGVAYHWLFFADINPAARLFAGIFVVEGGMLGWLAIRATSLRFRPALDVCGLAGGLLITYSLVLYPLLGAVVGHRYPAQPTFGLPCPTTIFTMGLLLWARPTVPWAVLVVPVLWSVVGTTAVALFGVIEDAMLPVAGVVGGALVVLRDRRRSGPSAL